MTTVSIQRPNALTKELALSTTAAHGRRIVISSNFLDAFGFSSSTRYDRVLVGAGGNGFNLFADGRGVQQVYRRTYRGRRANPFESQIDIHAQQFLDAALPTWAERIHVTMRPGQISVRPVANQAFHIRTRFRASTDLSAFVAMSSGVDAYCLEKLGFRIAALAEWRPQERRDSSDLTESGVMTACANVSPGIVFNEDITRLDMNTVREHLDPEFPISVLHACIQCDDFSRLKSKGDKARSIADGSSSIDMAFDVLRLADVFRPASVLIECVEPFATSAACDLVRVRLGRWGYETHVAVLDARDHGGYTSRRRTYLVATLFPGFEFPAPLPRRTTPIWTDLADEIPNCRDISTSSAVRTGIETGRDRHLTESATYARCLVKSQSHMPKDGLYLRTNDGRVLFPSEKLFKRLNEIPDEFTFEATTAGLALEQIGQSISMSMHHRLLASLKAHLEMQRPGRAGALVTNLVSQAPLSERPVAAQSPAPGQETFGF